jgi:DNA-binding transcriptional LysR family regulator
MFRCLLWSPVASFTPRRSTWLGRWPHDGGNDPVVRLEDQVVQLRGCDGPEQGELVCGVVLRAWTHLAAAGLGVTLLPNNVVPNGLNATVRSLRSPVVRELVAFARQEWTPFGQAFLDILQAQSWAGRPRSATVAT